MIFLASIPSEQAEEMYQRYRSAGVPIFLEPDYSHRQQMSVGPATTYSNATSVPEWYRVHVCLEDQIEDAKRLFDDPNYKVKAPVDAEEFDSTMDRLGANRESALRLPDKTLNWIVGGVVVAFVICVVAFAVAHS